MSSQDIHEIELNIKEAKKIVELGKSVERLRSNRDFKKVIDDEFLREEAIRLVHLKSSPAMQRPEHQAAIESDIRAIGSFAQFMDTVMAKADYAQKAIDEDELAIDELRAEGADE